MIARRHYLIAVTAVTAAVSLCTPGTARFVWGQMRGILPAGHAASRAEVKEADAKRWAAGARKRIAGDADAECAVAFMPYDAAQGGEDVRTATLTTIARMNNVRARYPKRPSVLAASIGALALDRNRTTRLGEIVAVAARGERLDPGNGFFPAARSAALLQQGRNAEGLAALQRAAACLRWNDHVGDVAAGRVRLVQALEREAGVPVPPAPQFNMDLALSAMLSRGALTAADVAARREAAGRPAEGIAIRHALMATGARMRAGSSTLRGSRWGCGLETTAATRPGGAVRVRAQSSEATWAAYIQWLRASGRLTEEAYASSEARRVAQVREIERRQTHRQDAMRRRAMILDLSFRLMALVLAVLALCAIVAMAALMIRGRKSLPMAVPAICTVAILYFAFAPFAAHAQRVGERYLAADSSASGPSLAASFHLPWPE
ncbi:MAG TPA: hypothetical protein VGM37_06395 [Armatimonadota bacterium]|jgi:hypothetical protein